jgi:hypothetical protein
MDPWRTHRRCLDLWCPWIGLELCRLCLWWWMGELRVADNILLRLVQQGLPANEFLKLVVVLKK